MTTENRRASFSTWYEANKEKLAQKRAEKYRTDPEYRAKALERAARQRSDNPRPKRESESSVRVINGVQREVFRIGSVAQIIGRDEQTIRLWEDRGVIPKPTAPGKHRYYTSHQISLLQMLCGVLGNHRYDSAQIRAALEQQKQIIFSHWKG